MKYLFSWPTFLLLLLPITGSATPDKTQLAVWANEAIVATYTYDYKNFLRQQRSIAQYFTAESWVQYSDALQASKLPETVQKNNYYVSSVAAMPPAVKAEGENRWVAAMPLLVVYKNPQYQQKQTLTVTIHFGQAPSGQGVRGLAISSLESQVSEPACQCQPTQTMTSTNANPPKPGVKQ